MREALNKNPTVQIALIAILGLVAAFVMITRLGGGSDSSSSAPPATDAPATGAVVAPPPTESESAPAPDTSGPADAPAPAEAGGSGEFVAGPGLPKEVVRAHESGETVVLLITRRGGVDDEELFKLVKQLRSRSDVALFHTRARNIARFSRITQGVAVDRVPALIVVSPRAGGSVMPAASVSYGFRGYDGIVQAVRDAGYDGKDLPYYPR